MFWVGQKRIRGSVPIQVPPHFRNFFEATLTSRRRRGLATRRSAHGPRWYFQRRFRKDVLNGLFLLRCAVCAPLEWIGDALMSSVAFLRRTTSSSNSASIHLCMLNFSRQYPVSISIWADPNAYFGFNFGTFHFALCLFHSVLCLFHVLPLCSVHLSLVAYRRVCFRLDLSELARRSLFAAAIVLGGIWVGVVRFPLLDSF